MTEEIQNSETPSQLPQISDRDARQPIVDFCDDELKSWCEYAEIPAFRGRQITKWLLRGRVRSFADMTDLPVALREQLESEFCFVSGDVVRHQVATDRTEKLLLKLSDGELVECVLMREPGRCTVCISTQVGCAMGCVFCASGLLGVRRNLSVAEITDQVLLLDRLLSDDERITNVVVMGIGEPLANYDALMTSLRLLTGKHGMGLGARRITVSTVGLPDRIREFARCGQQFNLAVSLHAPNDALRTEIVPVNKNIGIAAILEAADDFFEQTGRRITYEYVLLGGVNDQPHHARELAELLRGRNAHVNLIPMNEVAEVSLRRTQAEPAEHFRSILEAAGTPATVRKRKGADIDAACGQLRLNHS